MSIFPPPRELHPVAKRMMERSRVVVPPADNPPLLQQKPEAPADLPALIEFDPNGPDTATDAAAKQPARTTTVETRVREIIYGKLLAAMKERAQLATVVKFIQKMPHATRAKDDKERAAEDQNFLAMTLQSLTDAVFACITGQGWRVYPDGMYCTGCDTPLDEAACVVAAKSAATRKLSIKRIMDRERRYGERDAGTVLDATSAMLDALDTACGYFEIWEAEGTMNDIESSLYKTLWDARDAGRKAIYPAVFVEEEGK